MAKATAHPPEIGWFDPGVLFQVSLCIPFGGIEVGIRKEPDPHNPTCVGILAFIEPQAIRIGLGGLLAARIV
jgi:hypothetical protein